MFALNPDYFDAASALFKERGLNGASITAIAGAADAFPSQVTYYFRSKEAMFVEAACRDMLHIAKRAEDAAAAQSIIDVNFRSAAAAPAARG